MDEEEPSYGLERTVNDVELEGDRESGELRCW